MKNILVTGINGFIGRHISFALSNKYNIYGISRKEYLSNGICVKYIPFDISSDLFVDKVSLILDDIYAIVHVAANISNNINELIDTNCRGSIHIAQLAQKLDVKKVINISSIQVIGEPKSLPIDENHPIAPKTLYHSTKIFGEYVLNNLLDLGIGVYNLRISSPIGYDMPNNKIFSVFVDNCMKNENINIYGQGQRIQNYIDVEDISQAVLKCIESNKFGTYNIASDKSYKNIELAQICKNVLNSDSSIVYANNIDTEEEKSWIISIDKARKELGFNPNIRLENTIRQRQNYIEGNSIK